MGNDMNDVRIVIAQRGWVFVGQYEERGDKVLLHRAKNVRRWGTTKGLGELAAKGPLDATVLDEAGEVEIHSLAVVATLRCDPERWPL